MNKICLLLSCLLFTFTLSAQDKDLERYAPDIKEITDPDFEWGQFDNKVAECKFKNNALELKCLKNNEYACTCTELEIDANDAIYIISFQFEADKIDDSHCVGIVYDYENIKNFQTLRFGKKQFSIVSYKDGEEAVVKEGLYKLDTKGKLFVTLKKRGRKIDFYVGNQYLPLTTLKNCEIRNPSVGFFVENETKIRITGLGYRVMLQNEVEEKE